MYSSEAFGRLFWVDDDFELKSCPEFTDGTGDFDNSDYVSEWTDWEGVNMDLMSCPQFTDGTGDFDNSDYVSEWCDWEGVDYELLFNIHKTCLNTKQVYHNSLSLQGA